MTLRVYRALSVTGECAVPRTSRRIPPLDSLSVSFMDYAMMMAPAKFYRAYSQPYCTRGMREMPSLLEVCEQTCRSSEPCPLRVLDPIPVFPTVLLAVKHHSH